MEFLESTSFADLGPMDAGVCYDPAYLDTPYVEHGVEYVMEWDAENRHEEQQSEEHENGHGAQIDGIAKEFLESTSFADLGPMDAGDCFDGVEHVMESDAENRPEEQQCEAHDNGHGAQIDGFTLQQQASYASAMLGRQARRLQAGIVSDVAPTFDDRTAAAMLNGTLMGGMQHTAAIHQYCDSTPASMLQTPAVPLHAPNNVVNKKRARTVASPSATMLADNAGSSTESGEEGGDGRSTPPVMRGSRGQLAYDTQHMDERTKRRLLGNRESAARSQRRKTEHAREVEAALERIAADNSALQARLAAALCFIERLGYPSSLALVPPSSPA